MPSVSVASGMLDPLRLLIVPFTSYFSRRGLNAKAPANATQPPEAFAIIALIGVVLVARAGAMLAEAREIYAAIEACGASRNAVGRHEKNKDFRSAAIYGAATSSRCTPVNASRRVI